MPTLSKQEMAEKYVVINNGISAFLDDMLVPREAFPYTGWYEWGKHPDLSYEKAPDGRIYAQWFRLDNLNYYYYNWNLSHTWMRTAERKFLDELERVNRFLADNTVTHFDDGKRRVGTFGPIYWDGNDQVIANGVSTEMATGLVYEYFLRDNREYLDILTRMNEKLLQPFDLQRYETADVVLALMCGVYRVTQDPALLAKAREAFQLMIDPRSDLGLKVEWWRGPGQYSQYERARYKGHRKAFNFLQYYDLTGDPAAPAIIVKLQTNTMQKYAAAFTEPFAYQHREGGVFGRLYQWTADPDCLWWAKHQAFAAGEVFEKFLALPAAERGLSLFLKQPSNYRIVVQGVSYPSTNRVPGNGQIYFGGDTCPAIISIPMALWAIEGFPGE
jgi:hypothetical protein